MISLLKKIILGTFPQPKQVQKKLYSEAHSITLLLQDALIHHQNGDLEKAGSIYQSIREEQPEHADAMHL